MDVLSSYTLIIECYIVDVFCFQQSDEVASLNVSEKSGEYSGGTLQLGTPSREVAFKNPAFSQDTSSNMSSVFMEGKAYHPICYLSLYRR